jgi:multimeric flavodoxin WrbA
MNSTHAGRLKILGICASHRKGFNTEYAVERALAAAAALCPEAETELVRLADFEIKPCIGCHQCFSQATAGNLCPSLHDGMDELYPKLLAADGIIVGTPVYWWSSSGRLRDFIDRTNPFCFSANTGFAGALEGKVGGALAVAYDVHGGTEVAVSSVLAWMLSINLTVVGSAGPHIGGTAATNMGCPTAARDSVRYDGKGMKTIYELGRRVTETALHLKNARRLAAESRAANAAGPEAAGGPEAAEGSLLIDWDRYYELSNSFPKEQVEIPGVLATSRRAFEKFIELMGSRSKGTGQTWSRVKDTDALRATWLVERGLRLLSDEQLYRLCPEYYEPFLAGRGARRVPPAAGED